MEYWHSLTQGSLVTLKSSAYFFDIKSAPYVTFVWWFASEKVNVYDP